MANKKLQTVGETTTKFEEIVNEKIITPKMKRQSVYYTETISVELSQKDLDFLCKETKYAIKKFKEKYPDRVNDECNTCRLFDKLSNAKRQIDESNRKIIQNMANNAFGNEEEN